MTELRVLDCEPPPTQEVVDLLETTLAQARAGEISSVAVAVVYRSGNTSDGWSKMLSHSTLIGAVARLQHRLIARAES